MDCYYADSKGKTGDRDGPRQWTTIAGDMTAPGPNAQRIADYIKFKPKPAHRRVNLMTVPTQDIDDLMSREEFDAAVETGTTEGTLIKDEDMLRDGR